MSKTFANILMKKNVEIALGKIEYLFSKSVKNFSQCLMLMKKLRYYSAFFINLQFDIHFSTTNTYIPIFNSFYLNEE